MTSSNRAEKNVTYLQHCVIFAIWSVLSIKTSNKKLSDREKMTINAVFYYEQGFFSQILCLTHDLPLIKGTLVGFQSRIRAHRDHFYFSFLIFRKFSRSPKSYPNIFSQKHLRDRLFPTILGILPSLYLNFFCKTSLANLR